MCVEGGVLGWDGVPLTYLSHECCVPVFGGVRARFFYGVVGGEL